ncbi:MAG: N-acetylmuramoyl-L-alanine amidase [Oscillospiraceae bacterium]|nr:N-acetylmuramoyl-L-alanine amidase [Oscillospiraceae bacterium]
MTKKNYNILFYSILFLGYTIFAILMTKAYREVDKQASTQVSPRFPSVIIDPGHGGEDGGAVSSKGVLEKDINLKISKILRDMLESSGFSVVMTRDTDTSIYDANLKGLREKKISDLNNRLRFTESDPNSILISIHQNKFPKENSKGAQVFYSDNNNESEALALHIKQTISMLQPNNKRQVKNAGSDIFLLREAKVPAVIVECGFLSNHEEASRLASSEYQKQIAFCIYCAYVEYSKTRVK